MWLGPVAPSDSVRVLPAPSQFPGGGRWTDSSATLSSPLLFPFSYLPHFVCVVLAIYLSGNTVSLSVGTGPFFVAKVLTICCFLYSSREFSVLSGRANLARRVETRGLFAGLKLAQEARVFFRADWLPTSARSEGRPHNIKPEPE
jgi:hypothetical protein